MADFKTNPEFCPECGKKGKFGPACGCYTCECNKFVWGCQGGAMFQYDTSAAAPAVATGIKINVGEANKPYWERKNMGGHSSFFDQAARDHAEMSRQVYEQEEARRLKVEQDIEDAHKWDVRFLNLARYWAEQCSKDPSTKVGAVITKGREIVSLGYNGFPPGANDTPERLNDRDFKYETTVHAEVNAIVLAKRDLTGCTLYTSPFEPCSRCAGIVIRAGIKRVVYPKLTDPGLIERWGKSLEATHQMFDEAGIEKKEIIL